MGPLQSRHDFLQTIVPTTGYYSNTGSGFASAGVQDFTIAASGVPCVPAAANATSVMCITSPSTETPGWAALHPQNISQEHYRDAKVVVRICDKLTANAEDTRTAGCLIIFTSAKIHTALKFLI